ncbi:MAG: hypothetical protein WCI30_08410 [Clostridia bacterium]
MQYFIADPDRKNGIELKTILDKYLDLSCQGIFTTQKAAEESIREVPTSLALIRMGKIEINAFSLAAKLRGLNPTVKVIFISNQGSYAIEAFECEADGFLLLPFEAEKIEIMLARLSINHG